MFSKRDIDKDLSGFFLKKLGEVSLLSFINERCLAKKKLHNSALRLKSVLKLFSWKSGEILGIFLFKKD